MPDRVSKEFRGYFKALIYDKTWFTDTVCRNDFHLDYKKKCVDGIAHERACTYHLGEEKSSSEIDMAIRKFEEVMEQLVAQGKQVTECVLFYKSLRNYKEWLTNKKGYLFNLNTQDYVRVNNSIRVKLRQRRKK